MVNPKPYTIELWIHLGVCLALKKLELSSAITSANSYASFVLSNLPHASITQ